MGRKIQKSLDKATDQDKAARSLGRLQTTVQFHVKSQLHKCPGGDHANGFLKTDEDTSSHDAQITKVQSLKAAVVANVHRLRLLSGHSPVGT